MLQASNVVALNINCLMQTEPFGFVVTFTSTGDGTGSFQTVNFDKKRELIFITLNADSVAPKVSFEPS